MTGDPVEIAVLEENLAEARDIREAAKRQAEEAAAFESEIEGKLVEVRNDD